MMRSRLPTTINSAIAIIAAFWPLLACTAGESPLTSAVVQDLVVRDLSESTGKEIRMLTVEYLPGAASFPHRHNAQVFIYVLEGAVRMQIQGSAPVTLGRGETFYEGPDDIHTVSANASQTKPARILVFMVKEKVAAVSTPVTSKGNP
jgi:quercetin dioxygenase-like cupin family protein